MTCVEVGAGGEFVVGPEGVVPSSALDPCAGFGGGDVGADALLHLGEGVDADEVDGELLAAGFADVGVGVVEAGHGEGAVEVDDLGLGAFEFQDGGVGACGEDFSVGDGDRGDFGWGCGGVVGAEVGAGEDVAVEVDGVWRRGCCAEASAGDERGCARREGFHDAECNRMGYPYPPDIVQSLPKTGVRLDFGGKLLILKGEAV